MLSLNQRLNKILNLIVEFSNTIEIISINASISAAKMQDEEGRVFKVIATEIREISRRSLDEISDLNKVLKDFKSISEIINTAGRQRMLIQKSLKIKLLIDLEIEDDIDLEKELIDTFNLFESSHAVLRKSLINNPEINNRLDQLQNDWVAYKKSFSEGSIKNSNDLNRLIVNKMNIIVGLYQNLS